MSEQRQVKETQQSKQDQLKDKSTVVSEQIESRINPGEQSDSLALSTKNASVQSHANQLGDARFQTVRRQIMAAQMGTIGGNHYLQRVMLQMKQDEKPGRSQSRPAVHLTHQQSTPAQSTTGEANASYEQDMGQVEDEVMLKSTPSFSTPFDDQGASPDQSATHPRTPSAPQTQSSSKMPDVQTLSAPVVQRDPEEDAATGGQPAGLDGIFAIRSSAGSTIKVGTSVTYSIEQVIPTYIATGSQYHFQWYAENDPVTYATYVQSTPDLELNVQGPRDVGSVTARAVYPGTHLIKVDVFLNEEFQSTVVFEQTVTEDGRTEFHKELIDAANNTDVDKDVKEWTTWDIVKWKFPKLGDPNYIHDFKTQWVQGYRDVICEAAARFDLPEVLVAGVAYVEVGGDPLWIDDIAYGIRSFDHMADPLLEPLTITSDPKFTSFGNVSMQVRRAAETLGYDPEKLSDEQEQMIIDSLQDPRQNIFIAAAHLADLRDIDFAGMGANDMTEYEIKIIAARYNIGPDPTLEEIEANPNISYGEFIIAQSEELNEMLEDQGE